jgi:hypothetical protein
MANLLSGLKLWCDLICRSNFSLKGIRQRYPEPPHSKGSADLIYLSACFAPLREMVIRKGGPQLQSAI